VVSINSTRDGGLKVDIVMLCSQSSIVQGRWWRVSKRCVA